MSVVYEDGRLFPGRPSLSGPRSAEQFMADASASPIRTPRRTRWRVRAMDRAAGVVISVGGFLVIAAVLLVCVFLTLVVIPLFGGSSLGRDREFEVAGLGSDPRAARVDEYLSIAWVLGEDWSVRLVRPETGDLIGRLEPFADGVPSASSIDVERPDAIFGYPDGTIRQGQFRFVAQNLSGDAIPAEIRDLGIGERGAVGDRVYEVVGEGRVRGQRFVAELDEPTQAASSGIVLIDETHVSNGYVIAAFTEAGTLVTKSVSKRTNLMTGEVTTRLSGAETSIPLPDGKGIPRRLMLTGNGDCVFLMWADGTTLRLDTRDINNPVIAELLDLTERDGVTITAAAFLLGRSSLLVGDSAGELAMWFRTKPDDAGTVDGVRLRKARTFEGDGTPIVAIGPSARKRLITFASESGTINVRFATNGKALASVKSPGTVYDSVGISAKGDALLALAGERMRVWPFEAKHPESSLGSIAGKVWYEGYNEAEHIWQSSSGTDDFEEKFGLVPLVFGTIKATIYCMIFGLPVAILAAIYTSEFMPRGTRAKVKPAIEMMASLPSVVLGFLAAIIFAPFIERVVPGVLAAVLLVPLSLVLGACMWQLLPRVVAIRFASKRPLAMIMMAIGAIGSATLIGPWVESALFSGDLKGWLDGTVGGPAPGWMVLLSPVCIGLGLLLKSRVLEGWARRPGRSPSRQRVAVMDLLVFIAIAGLGLLVAFLLGHGLGALGLDLRGSIVGTYVQRNAMIVGFVMGFAVIPIIYTVAEDALSAVPEHLRAASLGAGATPWQTAWRVIVPTAMSGLFSAVMIGFGRAVGETMIVLMAAGNTSILEWNVFNGFRTLSANIAVELPEAVQGSTHYRMLFLAALVLFVMTFAVNTVAEVIRQRFRKRAFQL